MNEGLLSMGTDYEVPDMDFYKRAVIKAAPNCFTLEVLPPIKQGKAHSYGIRIIPMNQRALDKTIQDDESDRTSVSSLHREYEIWRRWDDCLDFQSKIETEYERLSREKKRVLVAGKHGKKGSGGDSPGLYKNANAASSFDSLPEGPDPKGIKVDVHAYIPKLTRKSSFFSVSDATVMKRAEEFANMVYALFKSDCPKLIMELRDSDTIRDFFAWWRRDQELQEKVISPRRPGSAMSVSTRGFRSESTLGSPSPCPPSPDSPGFSMIKPSSKPIIHPQRSPTETSSLYSMDMLRTPQKGGKTLPSPPVSPEVGANLRRGSPMPLRRTIQRGATSPQISHPIPHAQNVGLLSPISPPAGIARGARLSMNRGGRLFNPTEVQRMRAEHDNGDASSDSSTPPTTPTRLTYGDQRERPVSTLSIDSADYNLDLSFIKLPPPPAGRRNKRDSVMSVASMDSVRTTSSMDGVIPRDRSSRMSMRMRRRRDGPWEPDARMSMAVPEEEEVAFSDEEDAFDDSMSYLDNLDMFPDIPSEDDEDEGNSLFRTSSDYRDRRMSFPSSVYDSEDFDPDLVPPSPTSTIMPSDSGHSVLSTTSTVTDLPPGTCSVKAKYDDCIVALRLPADVPLSVLRGRLIVKFAQVQGVEISPHFGLAYTRRAARFANDMMPIILSPASFDNPDPMSSGVRRRPSVDSTHSHHGGGAPLTRLIPIWSQDDWELALDSCGRKVLLHILDSEMR